MEREVGILELGAVPILGAGVPCFDCFAEDGEHLLGGCGVIEFAFFFCVRESLEAVSTYGTHFITLYTCKHNFDYS